MQQLPVATVKLLWEVRFFNSYFLQYTTATKYMYVRYIDHFSFLLLL